MKTLSSAELSKTVSELRNQKKLTQAKLGELTGLLPIMIGRIEREVFIPPVSQLEALAEVLGFEITEMFVERERAQSFAALRSEAMSDEEKEGIDALFTMMVSLRQQILLRSRFEQGSETHP